MATILARVTSLIVRIYLGRQSRLAAVSRQSAERDAAVTDVARHGWIVARETKRGYYVMRCSCGRHQTTMHKTPRLRDHFRNKVAWMISQCSTQRKDEE
jgi:hypothetical protein